MNEDYMIRGRLKLLQKYIYDELILLKTKINGTNSNKGYMGLNPRSYKLIKHQKTNKKWRNFKRTLHPAGMYRK